MDRFYFACFFVRVSSFISGLSVRCLSLVSLFLSFAEMLKPRIAHGVVKNISVSLSTVDDGKKYWLIS